MSEGVPEDVLASIKRIISADVEAARRFPLASGIPDTPAEDVLELGDAPGGEALISGKTALASKAALAALSGVSIDPRAGDNTLDGLVRELLRPMLKEWLDANLPELVERVVTREVARAIGR
jgi:cell pole-organizing protein PopZ